MASSSFNEALARNPELAVPELDLPECPVFYPSEEEFQDPFKYIEKIRDEGARAGICKIVPPESWKPNFCFNPKRIFPTKLQKLDQLQNRCGPNVEFVYRLKDFLLDQDIVLDRIPLVAGRQLDLYVCYNAVKARGGYEKVCADKLWKDVGEVLRIPPKFLTLAAPHLKQWYEDYLLDWECFETGVPRKRRAAAAELAPPPPAKVARTKHASPSARRVAYYGCPYHATEPPTVTLGTFEQPIVLEEEPDFEELSLSRGFPVTRSATVHERAATPTTPRADPARSEAANAMRSPMTKKNAYLSKAEAMKLPPLPLSVFPAYPEGKVKSADFVPPVSLFVNGMDEEKTEYGYGVGGNYDLLTFKERSDRHKEAYFGARDVPPEEVERFFWSVVESASVSVLAEYGSDLDVKTYGSGFATSGAYADAGWNLNVIPRLPASLLSHVGDSITGVTLPWLYVGQLFATFCWHNEDNYLYSINFLHLGEPKTWYGVPGDEAVKFEAVMRAHHRELFDAVPDLLHQLVTMLSPMVFKQRGVRVCRTRQRQGEFIITFPQAYHAGLSHGFNCAEAVNFALDDWIPYGREAAQRYRQVARSPIFSHDRLLCSLALQESLEPATAAWVLPSFRLMLADEDQDRASVLASIVRSVRGNEMKATPEAVTSCAGGRMGAVLPPPPVSDTAAPVEKTRNRMRMTFAGSTGDCPQCPVCAHWLFLSSVVCDCSPSRHACALHWRNACKCDASRRSLFIRFTLDELREMLRRVEQRAEAAPASSLPSSSAHPDTKSGELQTLTPMCVEGDNGAAVVSIAPSEPRAVALVIG